VQNSIRGHTDGWPLGVSGTKPKSANPFSFFFSVIFSYFLSNFDMIPIPTIFDTDTEAWELRKMEVIIRKERAK
jgi:hypothetical protein